MLLATSSFWQGVDVVGEALSCVIIDKLPFASPGDPITAARIEAITRRRRIGVRRLSDSAGDPGAEARAWDGCCATGPIAACSPCSIRGCGRWATAGGSSRRCRRRRSRSGSTTSNGSSRSSQSLRMAAVKTPRSDRRRTRRPADSQVGRRQAAAAAGLRQFYPRAFDRFVEPFLGSGAVFLDCHNRGLLDGREVRLSDINADVIGCYRMVRDAPEDVIDALRDLDAGHRKDGSRHFYEVRDARFNRAARGPPGVERSGGRLHARAGGDADLPESNGVQRPVPGELARRRSTCRPAGTSPSRSATPENLRRLSSALEPAGPPARRSRLRGCAGTRRRPGISSIWIRPTRRSAGRRSSRPTLPAGSDAEQQARLQRAVIQLAERGAQCCSAIPWRPKSGALRRERRGAVGGSAERKRCLRGAPSIRGRRGAAPSWNT